MYYCTMRSRIISKSVNTSKCSSVSWIFPSIKCTLEFIRNICIVSKTAWYSINDEILRSEVLKPGVFWEWVHVLWLWLIEWRFLCEYGLSSCSLHCWLETSPLNVSRLVHVYFNITCFSWIVSHYQKQIKLILLYK